MQDDPDHSYLQAEVETQDEFDEAVGVEEPSAEVQAVPASSLYSGLLDQLGDKPSTLDRGLLDQLRNKKLLEEGGRGCWNWCLHRLRRKSLL